MTLSSFWWDYRCYVQKWDSIYFNFGNRRLVPQFIEGSSDFGQNGIINPGQMAGQSGLVREVQDDKILKLDDEIRIRIPVEIYKKKFR